MNSIEGAATLTLPYLSTLVWLRVIVKGSKIETEIVWKQDKPPQILYKCSLICSVPVRWMCIFVHIILYMQRAELTRPRWYSNPVVRVRWEQSQPSTGLTDQGDLKMLVIKNGDGEKSIFSSQGYITPSYALVCSSHTLVQCWLLCTVKDPLDVGRRMKRSQRLLLSIHLVWLCTSAYFCNAEDSATAFS